MESNYKVCPLQSLKEDNQTCTEASSELTIDKFETTISQENLPEEDSKTETKIKYRKLKQKLNSMGFNHDDKCLAPKDPTNSKKQRIMKLALDLEKLAKVQNRDYEAIQITAREINRVVEVKKELDLHLLRQSRFVPALFQLLSKIPSLHRAEFSQLLKGLQLCTLIENFASVSANRDYLILTNRLNGLVSFGSWILGRQQKKVSFHVLLNVQRISFQLINSLLQHKSKQEDIHSIIATTIQLVLCSQMFKKIKITIEQLCEDIYLTETDTILQLLKFTFYVLRKSVLNHLSDTFRQNLNQNATQNYLSKLADFLVPFLLSLFSMLKETESCESQSYPSVIEWSMYLTIKMLNCFCEGVFSTFKKIIQDSKHELLMTSFLVNCCSIIRYSKRQMQEFGDNPEAKFLLNQIIILLGYFSRDNAEFQKKLYDIGLLEEVFNLPVQYIMDSSLRQVYIPTFCCLINENKPNLNLFLKDNSPQPLIKALKKEISSHLITRKTSTSSLISSAHITWQYPSSNYQTDRMAMDNRFPMIYWESLCIQLEKHL